MLSMVTANIKLSGRVRDETTGSLGSLPHVELVLKRYVPTASTVIAELRKKVKSLCDRKIEKSKPTAATRSKYHCPNEFQVMYGLYSLRAGDKTYE